MTVVDAVSFYNELDLLFLRMTELAPYVDRFVVVEATRTHKGDLKPLYYGENKRRFQEFEDKIVHVVVDDMPQGDGIAAIRRREMWQRNAILRGVRDCADDDIILVSDCDELPNPRMIPRAMADGIVATYIQKLYYFNFNTYAPDRKWPGSRVCRIADARAMSPHIVRNGMGQPDTQYPIYAHCPNGGWHFSYFGGVDAIHNKMTQFLHQELVTDENTDRGAIAARVQAGLDIWGRENEQEFVIGPAVDLPLAVLRDLSDYARHFAEGWQPVFHEDWYHGGQALFVGDFARHAPAEGAIVEIGAWEGRSTITLAQMVAPRMVHVVDHWKGNLDEDADHESGKIAAGRDVYQTFVENMARLTSGNVLPHRASWQDWIKRWREPIAFLHLDASHDYDSVYNCLIAIKPYLVDGAIVCGDDAYADPVIDAVRAVFTGVEVIGDRLWKVVYRA